MRYSKISYIAEENRVKYKRRNTNGGFLHGNLKAEELITKTLIQIKLRTKIKENLFGYFTQGKMHENTEARLTSKVWLELPFEFHNIKLLHYDIAPDEFSAIIEIDHIAGLPQFNPAGIKYKRNGYWKRQAETMLKKERCKILTTGLVSKFKSRTTALLNQLNGTPSRILWENNFEESEIAELPMNEIYFSENLIPDLQAAGG